MRLKVGAATDVGQVRPINEDAFLGEVAVSPGDCLLLCSDGLTRMVPDAGLADALVRFRGDPQGACAR